MVLPELGHICSLHANEKKHPCISCPKMQDRVGNVSHRLKHLDGGVSGLA